MQIRLNRIMTLALALIIQAELWTLNAADLPVSGHAWTWGKGTLFEAIDETQKLGLPALEIYLMGQTISAETGEAVLDETTSDELVARLKAKAEAAGVRFINAYIGGKQWTRIGQDMELLRPFFEMGRKLGVQGFTGEPTPKQWDIIEPLLKEYDFTFAIHNHIKDFEAPYFEGPYPYGDPRETAARLDQEKRDSRFGLCVDTGHAARSGFDLVQVLRACAGRVHSVHLKDVMRVKLHDVPYGKGMVNIEGVLSELKRQRIPGHIGLEYEWFESPTFSDDLKQMVSFIANHKSRPPNVVLLLADDLGSGDLACFGSPEVKSPHLDQLASQGVKFTDFYAGSAVCSPSRACLSTGRFALRAGVYSWISPQQRMHLRREEITIATLLKAAGYATVHSGKWHLGYQLEKGSGSQPNPGDHGFDHWMATGNNAAPDHHRPNNFVRNGKAVGATEGYSCQLVVDEVIDWLDKRGEDRRPFFANIWFHEPHAKVAAPEELNARHPDVKDPAYYGCIENMDDAIGRLLAKLDAMGETENTLVIFASDNGSYRTDRANNRELRGRKGLLWEGGIRVPGIMRWPGWIQPNTVRSEPSGVVDLLQTICDAVGTAAPSDRVLDGTSLLPLFQGRALKREKPLYWFYSPSRPVCVIRDGDWCLVAEPEIDLSKNNLFDETWIGDIKKTGLKNHQLFHLVEDSKQTVDRAASEPERLSRMILQMDEIHRSVVDEAFDWRQAPK